MKIMEKMLVSLLLLIALGIPIAALWWEILQTLRLWRPEATMWPMRRKEK